MDPNAITVLTLIWDGIGLVVSGFTAVFAWMGEHPVLTAGAAGAVLLAGRMGCFKPRA